MQFGLITDTALTQDTEAIIGRFEREFEGYLYHVLLEASARADEREEAEAQEEEAPRKTAPAGKEPEEDAPVMRKRAKRLRA